MKNPAFMFVFQCKIIPTDSFHILRRAVVSSVTLEIWKQVGPGSFLHAA